MKNMVKGLVTLSLLTGTGLAFASMDTVHPSNSGTNPKNNPMSYQDRQMKTQNNMRTQDDLTKGAMRPGDGYSRTAKNPMNTNKRFSNQDMTSRKNIKEVQEALIDKGFAAGPVDGFVGNRTKTALRAFQRDNSLQETGRINRETLDKLEISYDMDANRKNQDVYSE